MAQAPPGNECLLALRGMALDGGPRAGHHLGMRYCAIAVYVHQGGGERRGLFSSTICVPCVEPNDQRTFAPAPTAQIIADLIAGRKPNVDIVPIGSRFKLLTVRPSGG